ncbi:MAG: hypothetical protein A2Z74_01310 [Chloroflexi bacterium RBG_13_46_9]|nr:MAG: hypothetical protein A2Z74_01310 [Chloroflexi bacterium RBG_13_46_9]
MENEVEALQEEQMTCRNIPIELLVEHPENSNFMNAERARKLRRHIERTSRYEPLIVRPHSSEDGEFQVINGHNRLRVLRALKHKTVNCIVWNIDDNQARLYLATLNRLSGEDVPERRAMLLENLFTTFNTEELASLLPDSEKRISELRRLSHVELDKIAPKSTTEDKLQASVILTFVLEEPKAAEVSLALDLISNKKKELSRSDALAYLAHFYVKHCSPNY